MIHYQQRLTPSHIYLPQISGISIHTVKMQEEDRQFSVTWRGNTFKLKMNPSENLKALGDKLQGLTDVKAETLRLIVPMKKSSQLIYPFSDEHSHVSLETAPIHEGVSIRMMGVTENEVDEVIQNSKADLRIAGFDEEEKRMKRRISNGKDPWKLPQGNYVFSEFRTLHLPGIELNPPASEALKLMHRLAADPGIVAIMNKHRWRVGIMTEMAPVGYVGVSPKCILGFNKNHGEEISLRLRTDDLNGFRKYDSIKKTLLHELAHMVHSEHDANFYALDKQLNDEAAALDWTKSKGHTLRGDAHPQYFEEEIADSMSTSKKLGGQASIFSSPRASSAAAAHRRFADASIDSLRTPHVHEEPDHDESEYTTYESNPVDVGGIADDEDIDAHITQKSSDMLDVRQNVPNPESVIGVVGDAKAKEYGQKLGSREIRGPFVQYHDLEDKPKPQEEPAPRNFSVLMEDRIMVAQNSLGASEADKNQNNTKLISLVTDPDDSGLRKGNLETYDDLRPVRDEMLATTTVQSEPDPDENSMIIAEGMSMIKTDEPDPDDMELERIQDPVSAICGRLQNAREMLRSELNFSEASSVLERIIKIIKNAIEHPAEIKFRRLRKANPTVQRNVISHKGAMEILHIIGFSDETIFDEHGKAEAYLVLRRNDPGLLWLAKTSLENSGT